jgi:hypothetical protein
LCIVKQRNEFLQLNVLTVDRRYKALKLMLAFLEAQIMEEIVCKLNLETVWSWLVVSLIVYYLGYSSATESFS